MEDLPDDAVVNIGFNPLSRIRSSLTYIPHPHTQPGLRFNPLSRIRSSLTDLLEYPHHAQ